PPPPPTQLIEVPNPNPAQRIFGNLRQPPLSSLIDQGKAASSVLFSKDDLGEFRKGLQHWAQVFNHPLSV
ncbi:MAG: hypothetical protein ACO4AJ_14080, partial [Prochlorothrix sp.]